MGEVMRRRGVSPAKKAPAKKAATKKARAKAAATEQDSRRRAGSTTSTGSTKALPAPLEDPLAVLGLTEPYTSADLRRT